MYQKDEKVLCFHHELLYEAKVLDHKVKDPNDKKDGFMYRVHYKGWKNTYVVYLEFAIVAKMLCLPPERSLIPSFLASVMPYDATAATATVASSVSRSCSRKTPLFSILMQKCQNPPVPQPRKPVNILLTTHSTADGMIGSRKNGCGSSRRRTRSSHQTSRRIWMLNDEQQPANPCCL